MLPLMLYEMLPLIYLTGGAVMLGIGEYWLILFSAMLFYSGGALIWIMRSDNRRTDHDPPNANKKSSLPEWLYEIKPFIYIFLGIMLMRSELHISGFVGGLLFICWGLYCLLRRSSHRHHKLKKVNAHVVKF